MRLSPAIACAALFPGAAQAHAAFGDIGPFYQSLLHPLADPAQGLILAGLAVLLVRQTKEKVQRAFLVLLIAVVAATLLRLAVSTPEFALRWVGIAVASLGLLAISGWSMPLPLLLVITACVGVSAAIAPDFPPDPGAAVLAVGGSVGGVLLLVLAIWGGLDSLQLRLGRVAPTVAGSWIAAIGVMAAALPMVPP